MEGTISMKGNDGIKAIHTSTVYKYVVAEMWATASVGS